MNIEMQHHNQIIHDHNKHNQIQIQIENDNTCSPNASLITPNLTPPDLLNCSNSSIFFSNPTNMDHTPYDLFATEKHRRQQLNEKFHALRNLIPNPTKGTDLVPVVEDAIEYTYEPKRTVIELAFILGRKESEIERMKKHSKEDALTLDVKSINTMPNGGGDHDPQLYNGTLKYMCCFLIVLVIFRVFIVNIC